MNSPKFLKTVGLVAVTALFTACQSQPEPTAPVEPTVDQAAIDAAEAAELARIEAAKRAEQERLAAIEETKNAIRAIDKVVYFAFDQSALSSETKSLLNKHAALLKNTNKLVRLEGHADELGTREYNIALGERRAKAVMNYLSSLGVPSVRIETISYGEEKPAAIGSGETARAKNRRVEIIYN